MVGLPKRVLSTFVIWAAMALASARATPPAAPPIMAPDQAAALPLPSPAQRALVAAKLYWAVTTYFAHGEALPPGYDFEAEFQRFLDEAFAAPTRLAFDKAAMRLMGSLHNGHTGFTDAVIAAQPRLPFRVLRIEGRWIVTRSRLAPGPSGLNPG